ncbi:GH18992 [Drosophila grimshawi]|uniref:GH18992 n=2 Tax=Drosophila grimshawi TaxID=7222 RepID=B4JS27_DROGR|nr:GH18992 [Drosophila grimshawi]
MCTVPTKQAKVRGGVPVNVTTVVASKPRAPRFFHRDQPPSRTRSSVTRNVYEFLSQSQIEDNEVKDPAADIIKQMVKDGKACVMKRCKGKMRARPVRKKVRPVGRRRQCLMRSIGEKQQENVKNVKAVVPPIEQPMSPIYELQIDSSDDDENEPNDLVHLEMPAQVHAAQPPKQALPEGAYSPLARSMLLNQTKNKQNTHESLDRRRDLLDIAKKFISTPMNRKSITHSTSTFSPIDLDKSNNDRRTAAAAGSSSPWRVPDELRMPNTFVFGLNTSQLPSYSSDFIRSRPLVYVPDALEPEPEPEPIEEETILPDANEQSVNLASNDSNGENVPPAKETIVELPMTSMVPSEGQENENLENFVQLPNPRRTLQHRSPLKDINILEVVMLPSWKKNVPDPKTPTRESMVRNQVHFEHSIENISPGNLSSRPALLQRQKNSNLFGFEDFLDDDDEQPTSSHGQNQDVTLYEKLQRLNRLRPADKELPQVSKTPMHYDYDDLEAHQPRQRNIKEMFCSTMIGTPAPCRPSIDESVSLFKDIDEPDTTFDEKKPRRTYVRERVKRKRKPRVHVLFIESGESDSEDNEQDSKEKSSDSPAKAMPPQKRPRKDVVHEAKLKQFITSFNQECAEVEKFPLIVE